MRPIDPNEEAAKGNIALWLSPAQLAFIADEWRKMPEQAATETKEMWAGIAFRAMAAMHKAGVLYQAAFPDDAS